MCEITLWQIFVILILFVVLLWWVNEHEMNDTAHVREM
jgi:amino acid transporter